jgi:hypothetical protein
MKETDKFCNKCGRHIQDGYGLVDCEVSGGYCSADFIDGDVYRFSMCEQCLVALFATFKLNARIGNYLFPEDSDILDMKKYGREDLTKLSREELDSLFPNWSIDKVIANCSTPDLMVMAYKHENNLQKSSSYDKIKLELERRKNVDASYVEGAFHDERNKDLLPAVENKLNSTDEK